MLGRFGVLTLGVVAFAFQNLKAEDARDLEFFEKKIRPALVENCIKCHSSADKKHRQRKQQVQSPYVFVVGGIKPAF